jgi:hypothetical protein
MPVLSYVHQLFNTEQCQAYIHTLQGHSVFGNGIAQWP